ncbi:hypothetical protein MHF_0395 [Mycoplasma haemofelis Ohio2]|uniref:Uncharacterized protein n=1 Tax=Mycoplasma haemofelis (strain Ohio2) TaxID=859194 RepID=F6FH66_MYCHI|nr:hypothetical protein MHF_0395 [Mycoplasma haemofelis Ohio2]
MDVKMMGAVGSLGAAATGGGFYLAFKGNQNPISISELFKQEKGMKLMTEDNDAKWNEAWVRYRDDHKITDNTYKDEDSWGISNWKEKRSGGDAFAEFKQECEKKAKVAVQDTKSQEYQNVKKYCSRPKKISELLSEAGRVLLDKSKDTELWNKSWSNYKLVNVESGSGTSAKYKAADTWTVTGWESKRSSDTAPEEYKTQCETKVGGYVDPEKAFEDETFKQVKSWCTK